MLAIARAAGSYRGERRRVIKMTDQATQGQPEPNNVRKDPDQWTTGGEPMTAAQRSYLHTLAEEAGEEVDDNLTKAEASKRIDELQRKTGRGKSH